MELDAKLLGNLDGQGFEPTTPEEEQAPELVWVALKPSLQSCQSPCAQTLSTKVIAQALVGKADYLSRSQV
jgi:hypothetical protein